MPLGIWRLSWISLPAEPGDMPSPAISIPLCAWRPSGWPSRIVVPPNGVIHHFDRGVQYASHDYVEMLLMHGFRISMARKENPYDNAVAESFIKTLKNEEVYLWEYRTLEDVQFRLPFFIQEVYNRKRLHSSLGYRPPVEFEELYFKTQKPLSDYPNRNCLTSGVQYT